MSFKDPKDCAFLNALAIPPLTQIQLREFFRFEVTIHTLTHLKCIRLVSVCSGLPCFNIGVQIELIFSFPF